jgi:hypothetical protein
LARKRSWQRSQKESIVERRGADSGIGFEAESYSPSMRLSTGRTGGIKPDELDIPIVGRV